MASDPKIFETIHQGLDLGFSDYYPGENVREKTIAEHEQGLSRALSIAHAEEAVCFSFFNRLGSEHPAAQLYSLDFPSDLRASLYLLLGGYYKQSLICLRSWFEMRMLGVYFGFVATDSKLYEEWKAGQARAPYGSGLVGRLFGRAEFQRADARVQLRSRLTQVYSELSEFTHGGGVEKHDLQHDTDNVPRYSRRSVEYYLELLNRTFAEAMYITYVAFGRDGFSDMDAGNEGAIVEGLSAAYAMEIRSALPSST